MNSALIMSCGTVDLLQSWRDSIITNGLSNCVHMKDGNLGAQTADAYMRDVEYQCIMDVFTLSSLIARVRAIYVNSIKGSCPK